MEMTLKVDGNQQAVLSDGKPVFIMKDGDKQEEFVADVPSMYSKTLELKGENKNFRTQLKTAKDSLGVFTVLFDGVDDVSKYKTAADTALVTMKNLDDKQLVDAGKVEQIKAELQTAHNTSMDSVKTSFKAEQDTMALKLGVKDTVIRRLTVGNHFAKDMHFSGKEPKTNVQPAMAEAYWGHLFKIDETKTDLSGMPKIVGHHPVTGVEILSRRPATVGEIADFSEAMEIIIENSPLKASITENLQGGSGAGGGQGGGSGGGDELSKLKAQYDEAIKNNDGRRAVMLKNQIFKVQQGLTRFAGK